MFDPDCARSQREMSASAQRFSCVYCVSGRLELPDGLGVPVSQLARLCPGVRLPLRGRHRRPQRHARESTLLPRGLELLSQQT